MDNGMEKYPENKPDVPHQGIFLVKGKSASTNGLSSQHIHLTPLEWDGREFGNNVKIDSPFLGSWYFKSVDMIVDEYLRIE
jgi:hypothetical protein